MGWVCSALYPLPQGEGWGEGGKIGTTIPIKNTLTLSLSLRERGRITMLSTELRSRKGNVTYLAATNPTCNSLRR